ncbi:MAG: hypothetical protein ACXAC8_01940 [Candidatus Hodarchaeales archaeon]|jgi:hypothetical protein
MNGPNKIYVICFLLVVLFNLSNPVNAITHLNLLILQDDTQAPVITGVTYSPNTIKEDTISTASCTVTEVAGENELASGIAFVICQYSTDSAFTWREIVADKANNEYSAIVPKQKANTVVVIRFYAEDNAGNRGISPTVSYTVSGENYSFNDYLEQLMNMAFGALNFIVVIILLALAIAFTVWWVLYVFKIFPLMLADLTGRIRESYGQIGVFLFILLFFPSILVFIIHFLSANIDLLLYALEGIVGDLIRGISL